MPQAKDETFRALDKALPVSLRLALDRKSRDVKFVPDQNGRYRPFSELEKLGIVVNADVQHQVKTGFKALKVVPETEYVVGTVPGVPVGAAHYDFLAPVKMRDVTDAKEHRRSYDYKVGGNVGTPFEIKIQGNVVRVTEYAQAATLFQEGYELVSAPNVRPAEKKDESREENEVLKQQIVAMKQEIERLQAQAGRSSQAEAPRPADARAADARATDAQKPVPKAR